MNKGSVAERRRLHRPVIGIMRCGVLVRVPANAIVAVIATPVTAGFREVLYDGRVLRVFATELGEVSTVCDAPKLEPWRRRERHS